MRGSKCYEYRARRCVEFVETDLAGIVHWSNFFRYLEGAEHEFFRSVGLSAQMKVDGQVIGWPRVHVECKFIHPLKFEDEVEVHLVVREIGQRSIRYNFTLSRVSGSERGVVARGKYAATCVRVLREAGGIESIAIPGAVLEKIGEAPGS